MDLTDKGKILRLMEAEKKTAFRKGMLIGFFIPVVLFSMILVGITMSHSYIEKKVGEFVVSKVMTDVFSAFPDAYFSVNRERVITVFDDFTNAASKHKITNQEFRSVGAFFLSALKDRQLTWGELDQLLNMMQEAAR